jgi:general secretion pathway protein A
MYYDFYQFRENPFNITADPNFFFSSKHHQQALSSLIYGIEQRKGLLLISGEVGTGKTTLIRSILNRLSSNVKSALILNPKFSEIQLLQMISHDLGITTTSKNKYSLVQALNDFLINEANKGNNTALLIDEAQNLTINQLEQIRLLSNLETEKQKLLQIVLVGQPELQEKLQLPKLRQLRQRIAMHFCLKPLEKADMNDYINFRILKAAHTPEAAHKIKFSELAIEKIYLYTKGFPRTINMLCDLSLLASFVDETYHINEAIIQKCAKEVMYCEHNI